MVDGPAEVQAAVRETSGAAAISQTQMRVRNRQSEGKNKEIKDNFRINWKYGIRKKSKMNPRFLTWVTGMKNRAPHQAENSGKALQVK